MALCAEPTHCLTNKGVVQWVSDNIPGYDINVGTWASNLKATMILNVVGRCSMPIAKRLSNGVGSEEDKSGEWFTLLPGMLDEVEHWDALRKIPISASESRQGLSSGSRRNGQLNDSHQADDNESGSKSSGSQSDQESENESDSSSGDSDAMDLDDTEPADGVGNGAATVEINHPDDDDDDDDDDEGPLVRARRSRRPAAVNRPPETARPFRISTDDDRMDTDDGLHSRPAENVITSPHDLASKRAANTKAGDTNPPEYDDENIAIAEKSFFSAWPEYDPANAFDRSSKIEEIRQRPRRKQLFGKPAMYSPLGEMDILQPRARRGISTTQQKSHAPRGESKQVRTTDSEGTTYVEYETIEEFLALPDDLIPMILEGQLCYRDGKRNKDGSLSRAKTIYRTNI